MLKAQDAVAVRVARRKAARKDTRRKKVERSIADLSRIMRRIQSDGMRIYPDSAPLRVALESAYAKLEEAHGDMNRYLNP